MLLQIGDVLFDFMDVPDWAGKLLIAFIALELCRPLSFPGPMS